jgi:tetratricopeptide (TPR) repeat protein
MKQRLMVLFVVAALVSGCAAGRAYRRGQDAARAGDWDRAVAHFTTAVQAEPDKAEYKISLERASQTASRQHITAAREFEAKDQLDAALIEYRRAVDLDATNRLAASRAAELERMIRERVEAARRNRPSPSFRSRRGSNALPLLNPASRVPLTFSFSNASLKDV